MEKFRQHIERYGPVVARVLLAQLFILSGIAKLKGFTGTAAFMGNLGMPAPQLFLVLTIALEIGGGALLVIGWQARWVALAFFGFTFLTAVIVHPFWTGDPAGMISQLNNFMKNLSIMGGMLYVVVYGPGPLSLGSDPWAAAAAQVNKKR